MKFHFVKYIFFVCFLVATSHRVAAQEYHNDDKMLHFGFSLGFNSMDFGIESAGGYQADVSSLKPGFSVGIVSDLLINRYLNLRFTPTLHFAEREISFQNNALPATTISSIPMSLPFYLKFSSERHNNIRPYLLAGGGVYFDLGRNNEKAVLLRSFDPFVEFGVGCDMYLGFFKLAPELKFAIGFNNMLTPLSDRDISNMSDEDKKYAVALSKLTSRLITLTFNFE